MSQAGSYRGQPLLINSSEPETSSNAPDRRSLTQSQCFPERAITDGVNTAPPRSLCRGIATIVCFGALSCSGGLLFRVSAHPDVYLGLELTQWLSTFAAAIFVVPTAGLVFALRGDPIAAVLAAALMWPAFAISSEEFIQRGRWARPATFADWAFGRPDESDGPPHIASSIAALFWLFCARTVPAGVVCGRPFAMSGGVLAMILGGVVVVGSGTDGAGIVSAEVACGTVLWATLLLTPRVPPSTRRVHLAVQAALLILTLFFGTSVVFVSLSRHGCTTSEWPVGITKLVLTAVASGAALMLARHKDRSARQPGTMTTTAMKEVLSESPVSTGSADSGIRGTPPLAYMSTPGMVAHPPVFEVTATPVGSNRLPDFDGSLFQDSPSGSGRQLGAGLSPPTVDGALSASGYFDESMTLADSGRQLGAGLSPPTVDGALSASGYFDESMALADTSQAAGSTHPTPTQRYPFTPSMDARKSVRFQTPFAGSISFAERTPLLTEVGTARTASETMANPCALSTTVFEALALVVIVAGVLLTLVTVIAGVQSPRGCIEFTSNGTTACIDHYSLNHAGCTVGGGECPSLVPPITVACAKLMGLA